MTSTSQNPIFNDKQKAAKYYCKRTPKIDKELKKIIAARILLKLVVSVAKGNSNYVSKFQLSSSNSLGDMRIFVTEIDD